MSVSSINFKITADLSEFKDSMKEATATVKETAGTMKSTQKSVGSLLTGMGKMAATVVGVKAVNAAMNLVSSSVGDAVRRIDTLNNSSRVFENMGFKTSEVSSTMDALKKSIQGLPTPLDAAVEGLQLIASSTGNLGKSGKLFSALNNGILGFGGSTEDVKNAVVQLSQAFSNGKIDGQSWNSMINSGLGPSLNAMSKQMGITTGQLKAGLSEGSISVEQFQDALIKLNTVGGGGLKSLEKIAKDATAGIGTGIANMKTSVVRGVASVISSIDTVLKGANLGGISGIIASIGEKFEYGLNSIAMITEKLLPPVISTVKGLFHSLSSELDLSPIQWMFEMFRNSVGKMVATVKGVLPSVSAGFKQLKAGIVPVINNIIEVISVFIVGIVKSFQHALPTAITVAKTVITGLYEAFGPLISKISELAVLVADFATVTLLGYLRDGFTVINNVIKENEALFKALAVGITTAVIAFKAVTTAITVIKTLKTAIAGAKIAIAAFNAVLLANPIAIIIAAIAGLVATVVYLWKTSDSFKTALIGIWDSIVNAFVSAKNAIVTAWSTVAEFFTSLWDGIKAATVAVVEWLTDAWNALAVKLLELWTSIKEVSATAWAAITEAIQHIVTPFVTYFMGIWNSVKDGLSMIWEGIRQVASGMWELIKNVILGPVLLLIDLLTGDFEGMASHLSQIWENIKTAASTVWDGIKLYFSGVVSVITGYISQQFNNLSTVLTVIWNTVKSTAVSVWNSLKAMLVSIVSSLVSSIKSLWTGFKNFLSILWISVKSNTSNTWNSIKSGTVSIIKGLVDSAKTVFNSLKTSVQNTVNSVKSIFNSLRNINLYEIGRNIIQGLISGINNMVGAVGRAISNVASNITGRIKGALGIHSPSRVFRDEIGIQLMKGLSIGISKGEESPLNALKAVASQAIEVAAQSFIPDFATVGYNYNTAPTGVGSMLNSGNSMSTKDTVGTGLTINIQSMVVRKEEDIRKIGKYIVNEADRIDRAKGKDTI